MTTIDLPAHLDTYLVREIPGLGQIEFEEAKAGGLTPGGEVRRQDWRAYYWTPFEKCSPCGGSGRVPSLKRPAPNTVQCPDCGGTGEPKRQRMTSISTFTNAVVPKDLTDWADRLGIKGAVEAMRLGHIGPDTDPGFAVDIVRGLGLGAVARRDTRAISGTNAHALLERYMRYGEIPNVGDHLPEDRGYVQSLCRFIAHYDPEPLPDGAGIEEMVCLPELGLAGRRDLRCMIREKANSTVRWRVGIDAKTQEFGNAYASAHLQLATYEEGGIACGDEPCDLLWVVPLAADGSLPEPMVVRADRQMVLAAHAYWQLLKAVDKACADRNKELRERRKA